KYSNKRIQIYSDSQAALKAINSDTVSSKLVKECIESLKSLAEQNKLQLIWVPGHRGHEGNEKADKLAKKGSDTPFVGPEPACAIPWTNVKTNVHQWAEAEHRRQWLTQVGLRQSKMFIPPPNYKKWEFLKLTRKDLRMVVGFRTGHNHLKDHLSKIGIAVESTMCRFCSLEKETTEHILCKCLGL